MNVRQCITMGAVIFCAWTAEDASARGRWGWFATMAACALLNAVLCAKKTGEDCRMSESIGSQYHWSPRKNREHILKYGLQVMKPCQTAAVAFPWICTSPDPAMAWLLSAASIEESDEEAWDLWQIELSDKDAVHIKAQWGATIREVRIRNSIPPDRVRWIGERDLDEHMSIYHPAWDTATPDAEEVERR